MKKIYVIFLASFFITHFIHPAAKIIAPAPAKIIAPAPAKVVASAPITVVAPAPAKVVAPVPTSPAQLYNVLIKNTSNKQGSLSNISVRYSLNKNPGSVQIPIPASSVNPKSKKKDILIKTLPFNVPTGAGVLGISELIIDGKPVAIKYKNQSWHPGLLTDAIYITKSKGSWKLDLKAMDAAYKKTNTPVGLQHKPTAQDTIQNQTVTKNVKAATTAVIHSKPNNTLTKPTNTAKPKLSKSSIAGTKAIATASKPTIA